MTIMGLDLRIERQPVSRACAKGGFGRGRTRSFRTRGDNPCEAPAPALTAPRSYRRARTPTQAGWRQGPSRHAHASEPSGGERARAPLGRVALSRLCDGLASVIHRFERDLHDRAGVLDHVLEALADQAALNGREILHRPALRELAQALKVALELLLRQAIPFP